MLFFCRLINTFLQTLQRTWEIYICDVGTRYLFWAIKNEIGTLELLHKHDLISYCYKTRKKIIKLDFLQVIQ